MSRRALVAALLLLAACDDKAKAPETAPPAPGPAKPAPVDDSACKLFTKEDAGHLLARPVDDGQPVANPGAAECHYKLTSPYAMISILVYANGPDALAANLKSELLGKEPVQLPGVGTRAYRNDTGAAIAVLAKGKLAYVLLADANNQLASPATADRVAALLAARM